MKKKVFTLMILTLSCVGKNHSYHRTINSGKAILPIKDTFIIQCNLPTIINSISHCDTIFDDKNYKGHIIKCFDQNKHLIKTDSTNLYESDFGKIYSYLNVLDTSGRILYESITSCFVKFHCYSYQYDKEGHLIEQTGYGSGEIGKKVTFVYKDGKLIKEITERSTGKAEKNHF